MRLHRLRMRAFGPFAGEQHIDFDPLGIGGLFLLDGPTGAGKSTVLDAITFALYGPGERGGDGRLQSHFAEAGVRPEVELEFALSGQRHRITRSPEFVRPKRRGDGVTREHATVHLERLEAARWVSRSSNKAEVGDLLADAIGLTRDQFTQVVLLPQGEFMRFLRAGDDDRRALLTRLFGAEFYDRVTDELDRRRKVADQDVAAGISRVTRALAAAAEAAGLDAGAAEDLTSTPPPERRDRLDAIAGALRGHADESLARRDAAAREVAHCRERTDGAAVLARRARRWLDVSVDASRHDLGRPGIETRAAHIDAAERAEPVRPLLAALADAEDDARRAGDVVAALRRRAAPIWSGAHATEEVGTEPASAADDLAGLAAALAARAGSLEHLVVRESARAEAELAVAVLSDRAEASAAQVERIGVRQQELPGLLAYAERGARDAADSAAALAGLRARRAALANRAEAVSEFERLLPEHLAATRTYDSAVSAYATTVDEHRRRSDLRLANIAAELAGLLTDGDPCPVCGAADHPAPARDTADAVTAEDVASAELARDRAEATRDRARDALADLDTRRAALRVRAGISGTDDPGAGSLAADLVAVDGDLDRAERAAAELETRSESKARLEVERDRLVQVRATADEAATIARAELAAAQRELTSLEHELADAAGTHASVAERRRWLQTASRSAAELTDAVRALTAARASAVAARDRAAAEAAAQGFETVGSAADAALDPAVLADTRAAVAAWRSEQARLAALRDEAGGDGFTEESAEAAILRAEQAAAELRELEGAAAQASMAADRAAQRLARFTSARARVTEAARELDVSTAAATPIVHLAKLARGMAGQRRVNLTTYVLRQWFEQVVDAANVRLEGMSGGRFELVRVDEAGSRSERAGLTLEVLDRHTGEQRSTRSLSGGETFYTSLALALGLADVVRAEAGGVDLDTLFIDEGFGSLDADTLDQVMQVIDDLRGHGRTVGIVSHVAELKHRISERIEVRRLPDGSSTLRVVA